MALLPRGPTPLHVLAVASALLLLLVSGGGFAVARALAKPPPLDRTLDLWFESEDWVSDLPCDLNALVAPAAPEEAAAVAAASTASPARHLKSGSAKELRPDHGGGAGGKHRALFAFWGATFRYGGGGSASMGTPGGRRGCHRA